MEKDFIFKTGIGQDSHRFLPDDTPKPCIIGGLVFEDTPGFMANSDGDVVLHALCNAITSLTGVPILGGLADELVEKDGITDSRVYLQEALKTLGPEDTIVHVAITIEGQRPRFFESRQKMCESIAEMIGISPKQVGVTATSGEGLTDFGCGDGVACFVIITVRSVIYS
jgi:2-C-methyl-D-erythritol 2,4-cyclodiphosphate synthase